jgi:hypothetical protein
MQKERAASALQRGLPVPTPLPKRVSLSAASGARSISTPVSGHRSSSLGAPNSGARMPLAVKLLGLGLGLLGLVYGLTLFRDHKALPGPAIAPASLTGAAK